MGTQPGEHHCVSTALPVLEHALVLTTSECISVFSKLNQLRLRKLREITALVSAPVVKIRDQAAYMRIERPCVGLPVSKTLEDPLRTGKLIRKRSDIYDSTRRE